jgi:hypothetical protein
MAVKKLPEVAFIRECVDYNPDTGIFTWRTRPRHHFPDQRTHTRWNNIWAGKIAGSPTRDRSNYWNLRFSGIFYKAHRVAWAMVYGKPVPKMIDHIDRDTQNNRIANLRAVNIYQSAQNRRGTTRSTSSGVKGIDYRQRGNCTQFCVNIAANGKRYWIGSYRTLGEAVIARQAAAERLHGEFVEHG